MSYTTIRTEHSVGDVVYWHDSEEDAVRRGVVVGIEARCDQAGYTPDFEILYRVRDKWAAEPCIAPYMLMQGALKDSPRDAFPLIPPEAAPDVPEVPEVPA